MLEPQSTVLFVLLIAIFGVLMWRTLAARRAAFRVLAACLAFVPAMVFGVLGVNKYYGYYQTWGAMLADITQQGASAAPQLPHVELAAGSGSGTLDGSRAHLELAQRQGYLMRTTVTGQRSGITRVVYVYLPPQYFQPAYQAYRFPVVELIHGEPGVPQDWITVVGVTRTFDRLLADKLAQPAVLVMPDANGGARISLQCLNQAGGPQDLTYLAVDLPAQVARMLRVSRPGPAWAVAGYSEGGFCAANMALRYPPGTGSPGCSAATSHRWTTSWPEPPVRSARSAAMTDCGTRTPRLRSCPRPPSSPGSGWPRGRPTARTCSSPNASGRNCGRGSRMRH